MHRLEPSHVLPSIVPRPTARRSLHAPRAVVAAVAALLVATAPPAASSAPSDRHLSADLDSIAVSTFATGLTPAVSAAVVVGDRIVWQGALGLADREAGWRAAPPTRFYVASTTKALTALAAARKAARGELDLDASLSRALPGVRLHDGLSPDSIRVRDLLTHTHGIDSEGPVSVRVAFTGDYTRDELLRGLADHGPASTGRAFHYSNLGYDLAALVMATDFRGWREIVEGEVLRPLGMTSTTAWRSRLPDDSLAVPYELGPEGFERIRLAKEDANMGPAGGLFSTAPDLARLVVAELNHGRVPGRPGVEAKAIAQTQRIQATQNREFGEIHRFGWGLGWDLGVWDGDTLLHRFGSFAGYRSHVSFMPRRRIGVVVLTNGGGASSPLADAVAAGIYDRLRRRAQAKPRLERRCAELRERGQRGRATAAADREKRAARGSAMPQPWPAYAGDFSNPTWGTLSLRVVGDRLEASMGVAHSPVEVYDAGKNQLRVELFGGGDVVDVTMSDDKRSTTALTLSGIRFDRVTTGH